MFLNTISQNNTTKIVQHARNTELLTVGLVLHFVPSCMFFFLIMANLSVAWSVFFKHLSALSHVLSVAVQIIAWKHSSFSEMCYHVLCGDSVIFIG